jgi:hypothetical protein
MIQSNSDHNRVHDTTIDDIHRTRERMAEKFDANISDILKDAEERQRASDRPIWRAASTDNAAEPIG